MSRKPYVREIPKATWYFARPRDIHHMLQEVSSFFIGAYAILLVAGLGALAEGEAAYGMFLAGLGSPLSIGFHWLVLAVALFHSVSWFNVAPKAMRMQVGEMFIPERAIALGHYAAWVVISLFVLFIAGVFSNG